MPLSTLIEETVAPHRDFGVAIKVRLAVAADARAGRRAEPGDPLRRRQHPGKCRRFRADDGGGERVVERGYASKSSSPTTAPASRPTSSSASASLIYRGGAARMRPMAGTPASVLACSSPAPFWSAPAPRFPSPTGPSPITAPWCRSCGRGSASKGRKALPCQRIRAVPSIGESGPIDFRRLGRAVLQRHILCIRNRGDTRP